MSHDSSTFPSSDFPSNVLKWMKINAKPKMGLKLMKCQKSFQHPDFPYSVFKDVSFANDKFQCRNYENKSTELKNFENIPAKKLWITEEIFIYGSPNICSMLIPKIIVCDIKRLSLQRQELSFEELKFLTASKNLEYLEWYNTNISFENGNPVPVDFILKCVPKIEHFQCFNDKSSFLSDNFITTFQNIYTTKMKFMLFNITSFKDFEMFSKFMEQNPHIEYDIGHFYTPLSVDEMAKLNDYVQQIIDAGVTKYPPPFISFQGQSEEQFEALWLLSDQFNFGENNTESET